VPPPQPDLSQRRGTGFTMVVTATGFITVSGRIYCRMCCWSKRLSRWPRWQATLSAQRLSRS